MGRSRFHHLHLRRVQRREVNTNTATISTFTFPVTDSNIRIVDQNGEPWFHAADTCKILGIVNTTQAIRALNPNDKAMINIGLPGSAPAMVNESGLYDLIFKSRKPEAKEFKHWVTSVVLPAIRKDGAYVMGEEKFAAGEMGDDEFVLKMENL